MTKKVNPYRDLEMLKVPTIKWWHRILLFFRPMYVTLDLDCVVLYKTFGGKVFIMRIEKGRSR